MSRKDRERTFRRRALALSVGLAFASAGTPVLANPSGATVAAGSASFAASGNTLNITNTPGAIINWQQFSIGKDEITRFIQQNAASAVLNRVTGQNPSTILGQLLSNGRVFLINPSGIAFGQGAVIDVAGLAASTLNITDADFLNGRMRFVGTGAEGKLTNAGTIRTPEGGHVYLIAPNVENQASGVITSPKGEVVIAAGNTVELVIAGTPDIRVQLTAPENEALNAGQIVAASGNVGIYGTLIKNSGLVSASRAEVGDGGKIVLKAAGDVMVEGAGRVEATGARGGTIEVLGNRVGLVDNASLDASGDLGGGTVLVGGDAHGANPEVQNAARTYVGAGATIKADALVAGDGGKVVVWSDDITRFYGSLSARGGTAGGNGGFAEVSGKQSLVYDGSADLSAPAGSLGTLLFDPLDIIVGSSGASYSTSVLFADSGTSDVTLTNTSLNNSNANVVLQAQRDISVGAAVTLKDDVDFIAQAGRNIVVNAPITTKGVTAGKGNIHLEADSPHSGAAFDGVGLVDVNAGATVNSCGGAFPASCAGGNITLIGGGLSTPTGGFQLDADVIAGQGGINVALSQTSAALNFYIGAGGNTQLSSNDTGFLKTTGALVLGQALSAGDHGLAVPSAGPGAGNDNAILLTVNSITNSTATPIQLSADSGSSFELIAGDGGITLDKPLTTYQDTTISTTGTLTINNTLSTSDNNLTIVADSISLGGSGSINIGSASFTCTSLDTTCSTLGVLSSQIFWDGGGGDFNWFNPLNWNTDQLPDLNHDVTIDTTLSFGTIVVSGGTAQAKSLIAGRPLVLSSGGLELANASNFSNALTLSGGTLLGTGGVTISGPSGGLDWTAGTMASGGEFLLASGRSGTLGGTLTLDRLFRNEGFLTLSGATVGGSGAFNNGGTVTAAASTNNILNTLYANKAVDAITAAITLGTLQVNGSLTANNFPTNSGTINVASGGTLVVPGSIANDGGMTIDGTATIGSLNVSAGSVGGTGSLTVTTDFTQTGGAFGTNFSDIDLTHIGDFAIPGYTASNSVQLHATDGRVTLNGAVSAGGSGDAIVISGSGFTNGAGASALSTPNGRWLVWSSDPASDNRGGLAYSFKQYNAVYPSSTVLGTGNGFLYSVAPTITASLTGITSKTYDGTVTATLAPSNYATSGAIDGDIVTLDNPATGSYADKNVGTNKSVSTTVALAGATDAAGATVYGYQLSSTTASGSIGTILQRPIIVASLSGQGKTYGDDDPLSAASAYALIGGLGAGDSLSGSMGRVAGENVGGYAFTQGSIAVNDGNGGNNYALGFDGATNKFQIAARSLLASIADQTKTYGTNDPALSGIGVTFGGLVNRTVLDINGNSTPINDAGNVTATLASLTRDVGENVGSYAITGGTLNTLSGSSASNYSGATLDTTGNSLSITQAAALTGAIADQSKIYGTNDPALAGIGVNLSGLVNTTVSTWNGSVAIDDTAAVSTGLASLVRTAGENVGSYAITSGTLNALSGASAGNYSGATLNTSGNTLSITQAAALTGTIADQTKTYGTNDPALAGIAISLSGMVNAAVSDWNGNSTLINDAGNVAATLASLSRNVGENVGSYAITGGTLGALGGSAASNYSGAMLDTTGNVLGITPAAALTGTIADQSKIYGTNDPALAGITVSLSGVVNTTVTDWNGNSTALNDSANVTAGLTALSRDVGETVGSYAITGGTLNALSGASAGNYSGATLDTTGNTLSITPATATYVADPVTRETGEPNPTFSGSYTGLVTTTVTDWNGNTTVINDTSTVSGTLVFDSSAIESSLAGQYPILGDGLSASQNYVFVQAPENATALTIVESSFTESLMNPIIDTILRAPDLGFTSTSQDSNDDRRRPTADQSCK